MIMPRGSDQLLLPVNPFFIAFTLALALGLNILPLGRQPALPDLLAVALVFWNVHQPRRVGVGLAFVFGLVMDVHQGALLGQHALAYTLLSFVAITIHRRLLWFGIVEQTQYEGVATCERISEAFLIPVLEALLWPLVTLLLLAPQRRAPDPDQNRPL